MLVLYIIILMFTNSINHLQKHIHSIFINRITIITLLVSIFCTFNTLHFQSIGKGISIYNGLFQSTVQSYIVEILLLIVGAAILLAWPLYTHPRSSYPGIEAGRPGKILESPGLDTSFSPVACLSLRATTGKMKQQTNPTEKGRNQNPGSAEQEQNPKLNRGSGCRGAPEWLGEPQEQQNPSAYLSAYPLRSNVPPIGPEILKEQQLTLHGDQYSLIALFSILGGSLLMASLDLLSMYLSIELQSFSLYILATLNKDQLSSTSAGLKYFLLGSLSSCLILLGSALIYSYTGLTQFEAINSLLTVQNSVWQAVAPLWTVSSTSATTVSSLETGMDCGAEAILYYAPQAATEGYGTINIAFTIAVIIILIGFLFKVSAAPFYQWAPDVYDGTPTVVTVWLTIVVKLTIFIFLLGFIEISIPETFNYASAPLPGDAQSTASLGSPSSASLSTLWPAAYTSPSSAGPGVCGCFAASQPTGKLMERANSTLPLALATQSQIWGLGPEGALPIHTQIFGGEQIKNLLLISSLLSLLVGTIGGLSQIKIKRLLAFSSISHVGFLLLALGIYTQNSIDSFIFYLVQYSITSLNIFLILLALGYGVSLFAPLAPQWSLLENEPENNEGHLAPPASRIEPLGLLAPQRPSPLVCLLSLSGAANAGAPHGGGARVQHPEGGGYCKASQLKWGVLGTSSASPQGSCNGSEQKGDPRTHFYYGSCTAVKEAPADLNYLMELKGQLYKNPILSISLAICLFSMAGIPPLIGFFSKQFVLFSSIENGNNFLSIIAILVSVISASYYLKLIKITFSPLACFAIESTTGLHPALRGEGALVNWSQTKDTLSCSAVAPQRDKWSAKYSNYLTNFHSYSIAILTFLILLFFLDPSILLNGTQLISLTIFNL